MIDSVIIGFTAEVTNLVSPNRVIRVELTVRTHADLLSNQVTEQMLLVPPREIDRCA